MEPTHPDTNASLKIFEMNKAHAFQQQRETLQTLHLTLTQWRLCSMQILLFCPNQPPRPHPPFDGGVTQGKISHTQCKLMRHINDIRHLIQCMYNS